MGCSRKSTWGRHGESLRWGLFGRSMDKYNPAFLDASPYCGLRDWVSRHYGIYIGHYSRERCPDWGRGSILR